MTEPTSNQPLPRWLACLPYQLDSILISQAALLLHRAILRAQASTCPRRYMNKSAGQLKRDYPEIFRDYLAELHLSADISPRHKAALHNIPTESFEQLRLLANGTRMASVLTQGAGRPKGNGEKFTPLEYAALIYLYHQASYKSDVAKNDLLKAILVSFSSGPARHLLGLAELRTKIRAWKAISFHGYDDNAIQAMLKHHGAASLVLPLESEPEKEEKPSP